MSAATLPVVANAATGSVAYEAELEIAPTRLHDVEAWLPDHVAELLRLPGFVSVESFRAGETADGWIRRKNVYRLASREHLDHYLTHIAPEMSARLRASFGDSVRATRRVLLPAPLSDAVPTTPPATATGSACLNCGAPLAATYCHRCGQRHDPHIHSLWHFMREVTENLTHADSRLWRTMWALLAKPGRLTSEFFAGRRARYLPPFRLYLVISVLFFLIASALTGDDIVRIDVNEKNSAAELEQASAELPAEPAADAGEPQQSKGSQISSDVRREVAAQVQAAAAAERQREVMSAQKTPPAAATLTTAVPRDRGKFCDELKYVGPWKSSIEPRLQAGCRKSVLDGGKALKSEYMHNMPRAMFVLLPLLALLMKFLYWRPQRHYVEHLLFFIHTHAALFLLIMLQIVVAAIPGLDVLEDPLSLAMGVYIVWYLYKAMRRTYGQGRALTLAKFVALGTGYVVLGSLVAAFTVIYSVAAL